MAPRREEFFSYPDSLPPAPAPAPTPAPNNNNAVPRPPAPSTLPPTPGPTPGPAPTVNYDTEQGRNDFQNWYQNQQGGSRPEDLNRFTWTGNEEGVGAQSGDTLKRWDPYLIKEGPDAGKYRSMRGAPGVFDKPTECPPGMAPGGPNETDPCVGGGGGGGGGGNGSGGGGGVSSVYSGGLASSVESMLARLMDPNQASRYSPEVMSGIMAGLRQRAEAEAQTNTDASRESFASRNMLGSGAAMAAEGSARRSAERSFTSGYADLMNRKAEADYQDKMAALNSAMTYLQQVQAAANQQQMTALQRQQLNAQVELAYANIQAQFTMLQAQQGYLLTRGGV